MSGKFALIVANTEYVDTGLAKLSAPGKDAEDFARVLKDQNICAFDEVRVVLNQPEHIVRRAIEVYFSERKPSDLVVFYFSGHGIRDDLGALYLAVKNTVRSRLRSTAIKSDYVREIMDQSRSKRQVLILDCCNSGAFVQGTKSSVGGSMGTSTAFGSTGSGRIILTASDSTQFAWEGDQVIGETQNSLFTHFLVKGLEGEADEDGDGTITIDELYDYAYEQIVSRTPKQTPGKWSFKQQGEIALRQSIKAEDTRPVPLPAELVAALENMLPYVREGAIKQLGELLKSKNIGLARTARATLEKIVNEDDSRYVASAAQKVLESAGQVEGVPLENDESKAKAEAEELAKKKLDEERLAQKRVEDIRIARERELQLRQSPPLSAPATEPVFGQKSKRSPIVWTVMIFSGLAVLLYVTLNLLGAKSSFLSPPSETSIVEQPTVLATSTLVNTNVPTEPPTVAPVVYTVIVTVPSTWTPISVEAPTVTPLFPDEPDQFVNTFFDTVIYTREYERAWSVLAEKFKSTHDLSEPDAFQKWKEKTWEPNVEWRRPATWRIEYLTSTKVIVSNPEVWFRASKWYSLAIKYCLVRDEGRNTWIIEDKSVCGL